MEEVRFESAQGRRYVFKDIEEFPVRAIIKIVYIDGQRAE